MNGKMQTVLFTLMGRAVEVGQVLGAGLVLLLSIAMYWFLARKVLPRYFAQETINVKGEREVRYTLFFFFLSVTSIVMLWCMDLDFVIFERGDLQFQLYTILEAIAIVFLARLTDWGISKVLLYNLEKNQQREQLSEGSNFQHVGRKKLGNYSVQYIVYLFAGILVLQGFDIDYTLLTINFVKIKLSSILIAILVMLVAQLFAWVLTQLLMFNYYRKKEVNVGSQYAINQLLKYIIYIVAFFLAVESFGVEMTVIRGGMAALLVGVGLGLQQTFNDLLSGILLLFERTVEVGHMVKIGDMVGTVQRIGLRTSIIETRDNVTVIVPNSKLVTDSVINWSHQDEKVRFVVAVGVAYGSDTEKVKNILLETAKDNIYVIRKPAPSVRFVNFGDSALDFELLIWSRNFIVIEDIKSDIRFEIDRKFREEGIVIPFPQRDVWMR